MRQKGYWVHTKSVVHVGVVEVAIAIHIEHASVTAIPVIRRHPIFVFEINHINYISRLFIKQLKNAVITRYTRYLVSALFILAN